MTTYPLDFPSDIYVNSMDGGLVNNQSVTKSRYSNQRQVQEYSPSYWAYELSIQVATQETSRKAQAFFNSLNGLEGSFLMAIPGGEKMGVATSNPSVNGADQTGSELNVSGFDASTNNVLKAGDYIQLGSGLNAKVHQVLTDVNSDSSGNATIAIEPSIGTTEAPVDSSAIEISNPKGAFRLVEKDISFSINAPYTTQITVKVESV